MYYIFLDNGKLNGAGQCKQLTEGVENIEVSEEIYNDYLSDPDKYIYSEGEIIENPDYAEIIERREKDARIAEIKTELEEIDRKTIRPARAGETERLEELEAQAVKLREELKELQ